MNYYKKKLAVQNDEHLSLPQIQDYRSLSLNKEITCSTEDNCKKYFSFIYSNQTPSDRYQKKPQHMRNIERKNQMLKLQLKRVSPRRLQYETLEEIYFIRYKKII
ncbi:unnamed protein product [Paramecium primaurelia]|uniref:Uncharacterized protein n=2 Tax=Paramecium TaxID=5884 RepID=A0A8S1WDH8_9CILI|nr:unnamed protein product [Paramecium primaurelia]CAD8186189.1 unnamed protein product [Paramecium pentaurelia]